MCRTIPPLAIPRVSSVSTPILIMEPSPQPPVSRPDNNSLLQDSVLDPNKSLCRELQNNAIVVEVVFQSTAQGGLMYFTLGNGRIVLQAKRIPTQSVLLCMSPIKTGPRFQ